MKMIQATKKDTDRLYAIIKECAEWLKSKNILQWNPPYPKKLFSKDVESGTVFCFKDNNELIGTATLLTEKPFYYPREIWNDEVSTWYLCRFAVSRDLKNTGAGEEIISVIENGAKQLGIEVIRMDIVKTNSFLEKYYTRLGYNNVDEVVLYKTPSILMEKQLTGSNKVTQK